MTNDPDRSGKRDVAPRYSDPFSALRAEMDSLWTRPRKQRLTVLEVKALRSTFSLCPPFC
jgi:hypothetical protein